MKRIVKGLGLTAISEQELLTENEQRIIGVVREGKCDSLTIHFKDGQMKSMELVKDHDPKKRIADVITEGSYQDIVVKTHAGRVTKIQNKVKVHF